jgi:hypothetical protein
MRVDLAGHDIYLLFGSSPTCGDRLVACSVLIGTLDLRRRVSGHKESPQMNLFELQLRRSIVCAGSWTVSMIRFGVRSE